MFLFCFILFLLYFVLFAGADPQESVSNLALDQRLKPKALPTHPGASCDHHSGSPLSRAQEASQPLNPTDAVKGLTRPHLAPWQAGGVRRGWGVLLPLQRKDLLFPEGSGLGQEEGGRGPRISSLPFRNNGFLQKSHLQGPQGPVSLLVPCWRVYLPPDFPSALLWV